MCYLIRVASCNRNVTGYIGSREALIVNFRIIKRFLGKGSFNIYIYIEIENCERHGVIFVRSLKNFTVFENICKIFSCYERRVSNDFPET